MLNKYPNLQLVRCKSLICKGLELTNWTYPALPQSVSETDACTPNHPHDPRVSALQLPPTAPLDSRALLRHGRKAVQVKGVWLRTPPACYSLDGHNYVRPAFPELTQSKSSETCRAGYAASSEQRL